MKHQVISVKEKLKIIEEAKYNGVSNTCQKYGINHVNYYHWLKKIEAGEISALETHKKKSKNDMYYLLKENRDLKKSLDEKEVLLQKYSDLISKLFPIVSTENKPKFSVNF